MKATSDLYSGVSGTVTEINPQLTSNPGLVNTDPHSAGWMKPHEQIYRRALAQANVAPEDAVMVGDRLRADVWGAKRLGLRAVWRRPVGSAPQDPVDVVPDATIDDLTELPGALAPWL